MRVHPLDFRQPFAQLTTQTRIDYSPRWAIKMKVFGYNEGDRSELLAMYCLSKIGHCVPVQRQYDHFGTDLFLHLFSHDGRTLQSTGQTIAIQIKSDHTPIRIDTAEKRDCFYEGSIPFFICIVSKKKRIIELYSTLGRISAAWDARNMTITLIPDDLENDQTTNIDGETKLHLGKPILSHDIDEIDQDGDLANNMREVVLLWSKWEQVQLSWKISGLPFVAWPGTFETNGLWRQEDLEFWSAFDPREIKSVQASMNKDLTGYLHYFEGALEVDDENKIQDSAARKKISTIIDQLKNLNAQQDGAGQRR
jgi:hypothetical protein